MMTPALSKPERDELLERRREALRRYEQREGRAVEAAAARFELDGETEALFRAAESAEREYERRLPRLAQGCCPFDHKPLYRTFDPHGLDGPWWHPDATPAEPVSCPHFCCLRGAVHFNGHAPRGGDFQAHVGPEAPYVIPAILDQPGVVAVVSQVRMTPGYIAYFIAYFAQRRPPVRQLAANWPRTLFAYVTGAGDRRWRVDEVEQDFDLGRWVEAGKLRWCPPDDSSTLAPFPQPASSCPYVGLPGERRRSVVFGATRVLH